MNQLTHYIELEAIPQLEIRHSDVMAYAMQTLHQLLPSFEGRIGIGFPKYQQNRGLGWIIRLFGSEMDLEFIHFQLEPLRNYFLIQEIMKIPEETTPVRFQRIQHKGKSALKRAEKRMKARGNFSDEVLDNMRLKQQQVKRYPHVFLKSASTNQAKMLLEIKRVVCTVHQEGIFTGYGLSKEATATIPDF
ncbi:type I-F CRISPR-associated endoribonuclease Cas6/Csy4 [Gallibacterium melopsittaci]|uniref:Type I-F CRISPR-associated endoribonuclease Cas6/Csy4 n=1 Tax=Gallibacterium melopsittaci TaxID=516063 RepID=A0ABV6HVW4_9PAST